jgi:hypothetical protein
MFEATNPRDYVYGLQGLTQRNITVDYTKPLVEVYRDLSRCYIRDCPGELDILETAGTGYCSLPRDWPSWMPLIPHKLERGSNSVPLVGHDGFIRKGRLESGSQIAPSSEPEGQRL